MKAALAEITPLEWPESVARLREEVRDFLQSEIARGAFTPRCDAWVSGHDPRFSQELGKRGWLGMTWPAAYGGADRSEIERFVVLEELLACGAPVAAHWIAERQTGPLLLRYGSEVQRQRFLPPIARGELYFAIGMSEPGSGSDLASIRTRSSRSDSGSWIVNGRKIWTSHAHRSHFMIALCRTSEHDGDRHQGLSQFIVDMRLDGVEVRPIRSMDGGSHFNEVLLADVKISDDMVVGRIGEGWTQVTSELTLERSGPERFLSTMPLLLQAIDHFGSSSDERTAIEIGTLIARLVSLRRLSLSVASSLALGGMPSMEAALVKDQGTRFESDVIESTRRLMMSNVDRRANGSLMRMIGDALLSSPGFTLRGGTNEILRGIIARELRVR